MKYLPRSNRLKSVKFTDFLKESFPVSHFLHDFFVVSVCGTGILHINMSKRCVEVPVSTSVWNRDYLAINNLNASLSLGTVSPSYPPLSLSSGARGIWISWQTADSHHVSILSSVVLIFSSSPKLVAMPMRYALTDLAGTLEPRHGYFPSYSHSLF